MIYPDDFKCLICKYRYYACKHRKDNGMLSCSRFVPRKVRPQKVPHLGLYRCFFGVCTARLFKPLSDGKVKENH